MGVPIMRTLAWFYREFMLKQPHKSRTSYAVWNVNAQGELLILYGYGCSDHRVIGEISFSVFV